MRKPLTLLLVAALVVAAAASWTFVTAGFVMGGNTIIAFHRPEALPVLYGALALFAVALIYAIAAFVRTRTHPDAPCGPGGNTCAARRERPGDRLRRALLRRASLISSLGHVPIGRTDS